MTAKLGILGGTFDPIHVGHLVLAEQARQQQGLDRVLFMPACIPPHKTELSITDPKHRLEMVRIAIGGHPHFSVSTVELDRPGLSYTIDTLQSLHQAHRDTELCLIVGADTVADVPHWRQPADVVRLASFAAAGRPGYSLAIPSSLPQMQLSLIEMPLLEISSSDLRRRVQEGRSIRYLVPAGVEAYIQAKKLYQA
jgi:nicotinate-nucleotide adenylyltransferase